MSFCRKGKSLLPGCGDHDSVEEGFIFWRMNAPVKQEVGARTAGLVAFVDHDLHSFHRGYEDGLVKIGADGVTMGVKIFGPVDVDGIRPVGIAQADGGRKIMCPVFGITVHLGIDRKIGCALDHGIREGRSDRPFFPVDRIDGTDVSCRLTTGDAQAQEEYIQNWFHRISCFVHRFQVVIANITEGSDLQGMSGLEKGGARMMVPIMRQTGSGWGEDPAPVTLSL